METATPDTTGAGFDPEAIMEALRAKSGSDSSVSEAGEEGAADASSKADGTNNTGGGGYAVCDLCNQVVDGSTADHLAAEHGDLRARCDPALPAPIATAPVPLALPEMGAYSHGCVAGADRGEETFNVIRRATAQLRRLLENVEAQSQVLLFGSCVTMGLWDGAGDADYTVYFPKKIDPETSEPPHRFQTETVIGLARKLRYGGFLFEELEVVTRSRVPLVRRKRDTKRPYVLSDLSEPYCIEYRFGSADDRDKFNYNEVARIEKLGGVLSGDNIGRNKLAIMFADGACALKLFARPEFIGKPTKQWKLHGRLPEVFSVDFDLSCRTFGIRNSWFLRTYMKQCSIFRAGNLFVKEWSKRCGINNSRRGFLTSYAVANLWMYFLLRSGRATFVDPRDDEWLPVLPTVPAYGEVSYIPLWPYPAGSADDAACKTELGAAICGFFRFYAEEFDWADEVVSLRRDCSAPGGVVTKQSLGWTAGSETDTVILRDRVFYGICIEDVYEDDLNLGRHLSPAKAAWLIGQFQAAWGLCAGGQWATLLNDGYLRRAEETLALAVHRHLLMSDGLSTVGAIRHTLRGDHADLLATYEIFHRVSELWHDYDQAAAENANNKQHRRHGLELIAAPALSAGNSTDEWAAVSGAALLPGAVAEPNPDPDARVIFLANGEVLPNGGEADAAAVAEWLVAKQVHFQSAAAAVSRMRNELQVALAEGDGSADPPAPRPLDVRFVTALVSRAFFVADGLAFSSYRAREAFLKHLSAAAECLSVPESAATVAALLSSARRADGAAAIVPVVAACYAQEPGEELCPDTLDFIFTSKQYVARHANTGNPEPTALLLKHRAKDSIENNKSRVQKAAAERSTQNQERSSAPARAGPIRRDSGTAKTAACTWCKTTGVTTYATNQPSVDPGRYCMPCWKNY